MTIRLARPFFLFLLLPSWILAAQDAPIDRTVTLTDENGTHEFEITRIFPDRVEVQRGQFKFYFNQSDVKKAENAYASSLIEDSRRLLSRISEQDLDKFPVQLEELEEVQAKASKALEVFGWLIPELAEMDKRLEENAQGIRSTLRIHRETSRRVEELVEKLRADSPVEATWTEVFDQSSDSVLQIPYDRIRETLVSRIGERRSQIETEIDRNTKYHSQRTQDLMEEVQKEIDGGTMNRQRWSSFLAQLERSIARIPLRRTREEYRAKLDDFISKEQPRVFAGGEAVNPQEPNEEKPPAPLETRGSEEASPSPMAPPGDSEKETGSAEGQPPRIEGRTMTGAKPGPDEDSGSIPGWLLAVVVGTGLGGVMFLL
ncbi:MAG: hypothetical protein KC978_18865, partial [Candidatus Omnitrophica bacterium]|nr:hypothetical protein [Candidatus Omnitrophota bacterium]